MVSSFKLAKRLTKRLNKYCDYKLYLLTPQTYIGKLIPVGHIWHAKKHWRNTLRFETGYFSIVTDGIHIGTMYIENRIALKMYLV